MGNDGGLRASLKKSLSCSSSSELPVISEDPYDGLLSQSPGVSGRVLRAQEGKGKARREGNGNAEENEGGKEVKE